MQIIIHGFELFSNNILTKPEFFVGLIVMIGYLLLRKPFYEAFGGFIKATVGYMLLNVGAGGLVVTFRPILAGLNERFNLNAAVIDPYFGLNAVNEGLKSIGLTSSWTLISLLIGFVWNIILVLFRKHTKIRTLFITGHIMVQQATTATWLVFLALPAMRNVQGAILVGLLVGTYWAVFSNLTVEATRDLTGNAGFAVGHQQMLGVWLSDKIAGKIGDKEKSVENLKLPGWLSMFNDNVVASGTLMLVFFGTIMIILGEPFMREIDSSFTPTLAFPTYIVSKSLMFAVYLVILMSGVRMFVAELVNSFQGIADRVLPGSLPAVDCAATYAFSSPNAVLWGFIFGAIGQFLAVAALFIFKSPIMIIPGFVPVFFDNATLAVFANKKGGFKAAAILTFLSGIIQVLGGAFAAMYFGLYQYGGWHGNFDWDTLWPVIGLIIGKLHVLGIIAVIILMLLIPQFQYTKSKDHYFEVG
ncbi:putative sugar-specific permease SgaT/UlaA [Thermoanaerobacter mathranii subsp. mathranii str. A3]|uniref:Ascorbate-specific PTS system EIIC component n=1 Tax=Thermoanaerobacter mathranii subsp. mathranii (strain DSM 11426 / CCUG 53645 / CIP 108742 / A3) TaxID=583358 RepID=A0ABN3Z291_THEM3|nr:PTS ascorbate transporter subunit IIC [Thermoanaerobacter mathranii]ADH60120.1 putative sugar-specific permease SgaT/UlaA [Thermoanaerobacter mathranii subsp. mathranii str. A3]